MTSETGSENDPGQTISLSIPVKDPNIFNFGATNEILVFLTSNRYEAYSIRELASYVDYAFDSVRNAVDVLAKNDLVETVPHGNRTLIHINRDRLEVPDDPILRIPQSEFHHPVREATDRLSDELPDVVGIILYGSVARGEADRRSDIDLWVLTSGDRSLAQRNTNTIARELENETWDNQRYEFQIDVETVNSIPRYTEDIQKIVGSGITLYEADTFEQVKTILRNSKVNDE